MSAVIGDVGVVVACICIVAGVARVDARDVARLAYFAPFVDYTLTDSACTQSRLAYPDHGLQAAHVAAQDSSSVAVYCS